ncbi:DJ-1/PfpI family protein [Nocardioides sp. BP30]|uniref:DJ-1/PfpI family protein n=1 Tax=Nocardioides sp. BP30 TaxID=3036374 RepID=UPI002468E126|nr:DJ-1/PfpI family protein [Nocardioides sp. BP30]WGL51455.1 DJ-1/PfpI family protein [Nocardioides sp. BP30]
MTRTVAILAFDDMEVLDYAGPYEVFNLAGEMTGDFEVVSVGVTERPRGRGGFAVLPAYTLEQAPAAEILIVPGGAGTRPLTTNERVLAHVRSSPAQLLLTVCTGALVAGAAGLLDGLAATTHHDAFEELAAISPSTAIVRDRRYVRSSDRVRTSGGISAGIDLSLAVVEELAGTAVRTRIETEMEWGWHAER